MASIPGPDNLPELPQKYTTSGHVQPRLRMTFGDHTHAMQLRAKYRNEYELAVA